MAPFRRWGINVARTAPAPLPSLRMKRLTWLLLAVFCAALGQIQPARAMPVKAKTCDCCQVPGTCGMPDCCPPLAFPSVTLGAEDSVRPAARPAQKALPLRGAAARFYVSFVEPAALRPALPPPAETAAAARVPLYKAQCRFLI